MAEQETTIDRAAWVAAMERQAQLLQQRTAYETSPVSRALTMVRAPLAGGSGWYAGLPVIIDVSRYQGNSDGTSGVDWDLLATKPNFVGAYMKAGEVGDTGRPHTFEADAWRDPTLDQNLNGCFRNGLLAMPYFFFNPAWALQRGWTMDGIKNLNTGDTDAQRAHNLIQEPHIYLIARQTKINLGRQFTAERLKECPNKVYDAIVIDLERYWMRYPIGTANGVVNDEWIAATLGAVLQGLDWLMRKGYLPRKRILVYSAEWFLSQYGNKATRAILDWWDTICAGYYWRAGRKETTWEGLLADLATIPNGWKPPLFGGATEGKAVRILQISGDRFCIPEVKSNGKTSPLDINVWNGTLQSLLEYFPEWAARRGGITPPPPPPPVKTRTIATVRNSATRMRPAASAGVASIPIGSLNAGTRLVVTDTILDGNDVWRKVRLEPQEFWVAEIYSGRRLLTITDEPEP